MDFYKDWSGFRYKIILSFIKENVIFIKKWFKKKELCFRNYIKLNIVLVIVNLLEDRFLLIFVICIVVVVVIFFLKLFLNFKVDILICESVFGC